MNVVEYFNLSWINVLEEIMMDWFNKYMRPDLCSLVVNLTLSVMKGTLYYYLTSIFWRAHIVEVKYLPQKVGQKEYNELGKVLSLMLRMCKPIFGSGEAVVLDSGFCVTKGITDL